MLSPFIEAAIAGVELTTEIPEADPEPTPKIIGPVPPLVPGSFTASVLYRLWRGVMTGVRIPPEWLDAEPDLIADIAAHLVHRTGCCEIRSATSVGAQRKLLNEFPDSRFEFAPDGTISVHTHNATREPVAYLFISEIDEHDDDPPLDPTGWWYVSYLGGPKGDLPLDVALAVAT